MQLPTAAEGLSFNVISGREQNFLIYVSRIIPNGIVRKRGGLKKAINYYQLAAYLLKMNIIKKLLIYLNKHKEALN